MAKLLAICDEDYLDWLENTARAPADVLLADATLLGVCAVLASAAVATVWLIRR